MMPARYAISILLVTLITGAVALIAWETDWGQSLGGSSGRVQSTKRASLDTMVLPPFALPPLSPAGSGYRETVERPLFVATRRPAPAGSGTQVAMKKGQFRLAGTTVSEQSSVAFLFETSNNKTHRINKGADINGMTVASVSATSVVLKQGDETEELVLRTSASPKPPPPPVAAAQVSGQQPGQPPGQNMPPPGAAGGPGFAPPSANAQAGFAPPGMEPGGGSVPAVSAGPMTMGQGPQPSTGMPPTAPPAIQPSNPVTNTPTQDPNQAAARRRRFQNLPQ
jgi:hypothetical protein